MCFQQEVLGSQSALNVTKCRLMFPNLSMLDLSNNLLKEIPSNIHELTNLSVLNVSGNSGKCFIFIFYTFYLQIL